MNLLNSNKLTPSQSKAARLKSLPAAQFRQLLNAWQNGVSLIWDDSNPQSVLDELGTDAAQLFALSTATAKFLETLKPGCVALTLKKIKPFTINPNETITIS
jgi:hypothetical protein